MADLTSCSDPKIEEAAWVRIGWGIGGLGKGGAARVDWLAAKFSRTARALFIAPLRRGNDKNSLAVINYSRAINRPAGGQVRHARSEREMQRCQDRPRPEK